MWLNLPLILDSIGVTLSPFNGQKKKPQNSWNWFGWLVQVSYLGVDPNIGVVKSRSGIFPLAQELPVVRTEVEAETHHGAGRHHIELGLGGEGL